MVVLLRQHLKDTHIKNVPSFAVEPAKKSFASMEEYLKKSEDCIKKHGHVDGLGWSLEILAEESKLALERAELLSKMLHAARTYA